MGTAALGCPAAQGHRAARLCFFSSRSVRNQRADSKTTPQEVNRLTNVQHTSRIDGIAAALKALGKRLHMRRVMPTRVSSRVGWAISALS